MGSTDATFTVFCMPALVLFEIALLVAVIAGAILLAGLVISLVVFIYRSRAGDETLSVRADDFDQPSTSIARAESPVEDEE